MEPLVFLCAASAVFKFVTLPQFILETLCDREYGVALCKNITLPENTEKQLKIQASSAKWMLGLYSCSLLLSLFAVPLLGSLADVLGKKRTLYIPVAFYTLQSVVYCILSSRGKELSPAYLFIAFVIGGLSGDLVALIMLASSYVSDITTVEQRTFRLTLLDGILNLSICIFIFCSGHVINAVGYSRIFYVCVVLDFIALGFLFVFLPNDVTSFTRNPDDKVAEPQGGHMQQKHPDGSNITDHPVNGSEAVTSELKVHAAELELHANGEERTGDMHNTNTQEMHPMADKETKDEQPQYRSTSSLKKIAEISFKQLLIQSNPIRRFRQLAKSMKEQGHTAHMGILLFLLAAASMCIVGESLTLVLYIKNQPFNMNPVSVGHLMSLQGLLRFLGGFLLLNIYFQRFSRLKDINVISLAFVINLAYYIFLGIASSVKMLYGIQILGVFGPLAGPTLRSIVSKKGNSENYAIILSLAQTIDALGSLAVNLIVNSTYMVMVKLYPGAFCFTLAGISAFGAVMSIVVRRYEHDANSHQTPADDATNKTPSDVIQ